MNANLGHSLKYSTESEIPNIGIMIKKERKNSIPLEEGCPKQPKSLF